MKTAEHATPSDAVLEAVGRLTGVCVGMSPAGDLAVGASYFGLQVAQDLCHGLAAKSGWWLDTETGEDVRTWPKRFMDLWISAKLMLVVTEVAEAMEGHRKGKMDDHLPHRSMLEVELADAYIRIADLAGGLGLDMAGAVIEKLAYNQQRADHQLANRQAAGGKSI